VCVPIVFDAKPHPAPLHHDAVIPVAYCPSELAISEAPGLVCLPVVYALDSCALFFRYSHATSPWFVRHCLTFSGVQVKERTLGSESNVLIFNYSYSLDLSVWSSCTMQA